MRSLFVLAFVVAVIPAASPAFAQTTPSITVEQPWARATPAGAQTGAVYLTLENKSTSADRLTGASSDVAAQSQIHEMTMANGVMQMRQVADGLAVPAGGSVVLKPGSYHVMLIGLKKPLTAGESFPLTLNFEKAGKISVTVPIQSMSAGSSGGMAPMNDKGGGMGSMEMK